MKFYSIQLVGVDERGYIEYIRNIRDLFSSKEAAMKHGEELGGEFYILELDVMKTYNGKDGKEIK